MPSGRSRTITGRREPDYPASVFGVRAAEPGYRRFVFAPRPGALEWAHAAVPTPHGEIVVSWGLRDGVFEASLSAPPGTEALVLIPLASLRHSEISVNGRPVWPPEAAEGVAGVSPGREETGCVAFDLWGGQAYRFRSR